MIVSQRRIDANRRNAQLSSGPKTVEGKAICRANALKHGLCASVVVVEDQTLLNIRANEIYQALRPQDSYQSRLVESIAVWSIRIDRSERLERRVRDKICLRAELTWDDDRTLEAEIVGGRLSIRPAEVVEILRRTPQGCEWLMSRWALLAHAALTNENHAWTDEQVALAFDLLATPAAFRAGRKPGVSLDFEGNVVDSADDPVAVARRQVLELKERREVVSGLDKVERSLASVDLGHDNDPELKRLRRYEGNLHRRVRWAVAEIRTDSPYRPLIPELSPGWGLTPEDVPKPERKTEDEKLAEAHPPDSFSPPFDLVPEEFPPPGQRADIPAILKSRREKRLLKEQTSRDNRRRRLEVLRS